jgi:hypothetical protein
MSSKREIVIACMLVVAVIGAAVAVVAWNVGRALPWLNTAAWIALVVLGLSMAIVSLLLARRMAPTRQQPISETRAEFVQMGIGFALMGAISSLGQGILGLVSLLLAMYVPTIIKQVRKGR